jgi:hypothetical protein
MEQYLSPGKLVGFWMAFTVHSETYSMHRGF